MTHIQHTPKLLSDIIPSIFTKPPDFFFLTKNFRQIRLSQQPAIPCSPWAHLGVGFQWCRVLLWSYKVPNGQSLGYFFRPTFFFTPRKWTTVRGYTPPEIGTKRCIYIYIPPPQKNVGKLENVCVFLSFQIWPSFRFLGGHSGIAKSPKMFHTFSGFKDIITKHFRYLKWRY